MNIKFPFFALVLLLAVVLVSSFAIGFPQKFFEEKTANEAVKTVVNPVSSEKNSSQEIFYATTE